uniref:Ig-like domain-containing protein n=1 Tax=Haplochromis burtoni TaxID=8153 RepID=A0A3Q2WUZ7_HAPBU
MRQTYLIYIVVGFLLIFFTGSSLSDQVFQTPADMYKNQEQTAEINCSHSIAGYDRILWYKQTKSKQLHFLGYMVVSQGAPEPGWRKLVPGDSGVYFCAVSLTDGGDVSTTAESSYLQKYCYQKLHEVNGCIFS